MLAIRLLLIFPAIIVFIMLAVGMVFALISPFMILPWLLLSVLSGGLYYYLNQLCDIIADDNAVTLQLGYVAIMAIAVVAGVVAILMQGSYLINSNNVLFYPDIVFLLAALAHTFASLKLAWCYFQRLKLSQ